MEEWNSQTLTINRRSSWSNHLGEHFVISRSFIGATIKDTRTKARGSIEVGEGGGIGWGGVEGWGENADNCN